MSGMLGKLPQRVDERTLKMAKYIAKPIAPPASQDWTSKPAQVFYQPWPMFLNDELGDCVPAAIGHMIAGWSANAGKPFMPTEDQILTAYELIGGYEPGDPSTDNGCVMLDALKHWRKKGIAGQHIRAFVEINHKSQTEMKDAIWLFGAAYIGVQLPISAEGETSWMVPADGTQGQDAPGTWGGHCVPVVGYDSGGLTVITWGQKLLMSWGFLAAYCDEAYAVLSQNWIDSTQHAPNEFDLSALEIDLKKL